MTNVLIDGGRRQGRTLTNERAILAALAEGNRVFVLRNGVYLEATQENGAVSYKALPQKPEGLD